MIAGFLYQAHGIAQPTPVVRMASSGGSPLSNNPDILFDRAGFGLIEAGYMVNGEPVLGFPFLYYGWNNGSVTTADGKTFSKYKLKYNINNQTVFFSDGKDSLEATDPIREFSLWIPREKTVEKYTFINASLLGKTKEPFYYEVMADSADWELLKVNRKPVRPVQNGLPVKQARKAFQLDTEYFFYNKQAKKIIPAKGDASRLASALKLSDDDKTRLQIARFDFGKEPDLISFFALLSGSRVP